MTRGVFYVKKKFRNSAPVSYCTPKGMLLYVRPNYLDVQINNHKNCG
jgi:hypothetical protein